MLKAKGFQISHFSARHNLWCACMHSSEGVTAKLFWGGGTDRQLSEIADPKQGTREIFELRMYTTVRNICDSIQGHT